MKGSDLVLLPSPLLCVPSSAGMQTEVREPAMPVDAVPLVQSLGEGRLQISRGKQEDIQHSLL